MASALPGSMDCTDLCLNPVYKTALHNRCVLGDSGKPGFVWLAVLNRNNQGASLTFWEISI